LTVRGIAPVPRAALPLNSISFDKDSFVMTKRSLLSRLTGWPLLKVPYRSHWRAMMMAHPLIVLLIEDNIDGETRRASLAEWLRAERPVLALYRGTNSRLRVDGPRQTVDYQAFAMGSLLESPGVIARLDPVETLQLEQRVSDAIEREILGWIDEHGLRDNPPANPAIDRDNADHKAVARMFEWTASKDWLEVT
jgi:hypothetical protein